MPALPDIPLENIEQAIAALRPLSPAAQVEAAVTIMEALIADRHESPARAAKLVLELFEAARA